MPSRILVTNNEYTIAPDKSSVLITGLIDETGNFSTKSVAVKTHALHVQLNPALGNSLQIITPDDGEVTLTKPVKNKLSAVESLDWTHRIFFVRIDLLPPN
jgi:nanoRNase/pAp phosphatase (c-di-AMP/oligoRNAs hydrolase)